MDRSSLLDNSSNSNIRVTTDDDSSDSGRSSKLCPEKKKKTKEAYSRKRHRAEHHRQSSNMGFPCGTGGGPLSKDLKGEQEDSLDSSDEEAGRRPPELVRSKPLRSFLIDDILGNHTKPKQQAAHLAGSHLDHQLCSASSLARIVRPWDVVAPRPSFGSSAFGSLASARQHQQQHARSPPGGGRPRSANDESFDGSEASEDSESPVSSSNGKVHSSNNNNTHSSPLDALFQMTNKTLDNLNNTDKTGGEPFSD